MKTNAKKKVIAKKNILLNSGMKVSNQNKKILGQSVIDQPLVSSPQIDKMVCVVDVPDPALHGQFVSALLDLAKDDEFLFVEKKGNGMYPIAVSIRCPDKDGIFPSKGPELLVQATLKDHPKRQIRFVFNPTKLFSPMNSLMPDAGDPVKDYLDETFQGLWGDGFFELLHHARVTYLEVWRHVIGRSPEDYLFRVNYSQTCQSLFGGSKKLETMYFGKASGNQIAIYNKAKELNSKAKHDTIRVEARLKPKGLKVLGLWGLTNPFQKVRIYSLKNDHPPFGNGHWIAFQDACRFRGISEAIKVQPVSMQGKLKKSVSENAVSWWQLDDDEWTNQWHEALELSWLNRIPENAAPLNLYGINGSY